MPCTTPDEMMAQYTAALFASDWKGCSDLYEDDAVYYRPNQVLAQDRAAIEAHYRSVVERSHDEVVEAPAARRRTASPGAH